MEILYFLPVPRDAAIATLSSRVPEQFWDTLLLFPVSHVYYTSSQGLMGYHLLAWNHISEVVTVRA
jgi:hypothetical protein